MKAKKEIEDLIKLRIKEIKEYEELLSKAKSEDYILLKNLIRKIIYANEQTIKDLDWVLNDTSK